MMTATDEMRQKKGTSSVPKGPRSGCLQKWCGAGVRDAGSNARHVFAPAATHPNFNFSEFWSVPLTVMEGDGQ